MAATPTSMASSSSMVAAVLVLCAAALFLSADGRHVVAESGKKEGEKAGGGNNGDLVSQACLNAAMHFSRHGHLTQKQCESLLRSDKRVAAAKGPRDLALVAVDLLQRGAAEAVRKVDAAILARGINKSEAWEWEGSYTLEYCQASYMVVDHVAPLCRALVQKYSKHPRPRPGEPDEDEDETEAALPYFGCANKLKEAARECWASFDRLSSSKVVDEVRAAVEEPYRRAILVKALVEEMVGVLDEDE